MASGEFLEKAVKDGAYLIVAQDASDNTEKKMFQYDRFYQVPMNIRQRNARAFHRKRISHHSLNEGLSHFDRRD